MSDQLDRGVLGGFVAGAVIGAGIALLLAPAAGSDTRRRLREGMGELRDSAGSGVESARNSVRSTARHFGDALKEGAEAFRHASVEATEPAPKRS